ncbi:hypothetical protein H2198_008901 [Neophaeococcomyces mojaviensis]|uniref:Uncharacterized protein n=1 Tax=Neophaeococcomyces mojaviensis TaxID=3383035 RepID=A0ACC2ZW17_9EURO|nr:hypothetical protein H2198_008901 [Knufia sp. JES_112]
MPSIEGGDLDLNGQPMKMLPTPPHEPSSGGLALNGILTLADYSDKLSTSSTGNGLHNGERSPESGLKITQYHDPALDDLTPRSPRLGLHVPVRTPNHPSGRHASVGGYESNMRRASYEVSLSPRAGERSLSKKYSRERLRDLTKVSDSSSVAVLSPTLSDSREPEIRSHVLPKPPHRADEGRALHSVSPALNDSLRRVSNERAPGSKGPRNLTINVEPDVCLPEGAPLSGRPRVPRALSTPASIKSPNGSILQENRKVRSSSKPDPSKPRNLVIPSHPPPSPLPASIPMPPLSLSTYLQLELSSQRPSQLYIHRSSANDFPYESSRVKIERLLDFFFLPAHLEGVLWFGVFACLDAWLYTFTILPLRMIKSIYILGKSWILNFLNEVRFVISFIYSGSQRMWVRRRTRASSGSMPLSQTNSETQPSANVGRPKSRSGKQHRRTKSRPSSLLPDDKADILQGFLIICTCLVLLKLDASRMYHWVRGQAAIKLYVIYNLLEVCDRLLSAIGQDVLECLFSKEALERKPDGRSKVWWPFLLFLFALAYSATHATALFYQVVTLNVAVNSYSNALITLLISNQFVEIKSTVFKKFDKENLFQLTCADIVERFQLWHMLMIIAGRNIVETGGINFGIPKILAPAATATASSSPNITQAAPPLTAASVLPRSFTVVPNVLSSISSYVPTIGPVLGPFVIVLGSEMVIDSLKHAYINKFNNTKPAIYGRFLDVLAKDYYTNAFAEQNLTKRLGLPVIPLSCLMIRTGFQTYQMLTASWSPSPSSSNAATLASIHSQYSTTRSQPTSTAGMIVRKMDELFGQLPATIFNSSVASHFTTILWSILIFLILLVIKLVLGMGLLAYSRHRYKAMKEREHNPSYYLDGGRRVGGWGVVEVDEDKRRVIYEDDPAGLQALRNKEVKEKASREKEKEKGFSYEGLEKVNRYEMAAKRIW